MDVNYFSFFTNLTEILMITFWLLLLKTWQRLEMKLLRLGIL